MSKKYVTGLEAFKKLENIDNRYLTEADSFISLTEDESEPVCEKRTLSDRLEFTRSGWFAAAVSAVVALAAVVFIVRAGGSAQKTVPGPTAAGTPTPGIGENVDAGNETECETVQTVEQPNEALDPRAQQKIAAKEEWRKNHPQEAETTVTRSWDDLTDEEKAQLEEMLRNQHLHVYDRNGGSCIICGQKDGSYEMLREHLPCNHRMTAEEQEKAARIAAYLDDLGIAYGYVAYNDEGIVVTTPKGAYPDTHYGRSQLELQGYRIAAALVGKNMPVKELAWWIFDENEYGFLSMQMCHSGDFVAPPITHNAYREWTDEELLAVVSDVFDEKLADGWSVRFARMEDKEWLSICFEIDETMTVDGDRLSLLMNEVWRRMNKSVGLISVYFSYPGDTDTRADFFIDYVNTHAGCGTNGENIGAWSQPSVPMFE